jgi:endoglucanase
MRFLGGVPESYLDREKNPVRWFDDGAFGMWDLPECEIRDGLVHGRVCDDLIGCVAIIALLEDLEQSQAEGACHGIFTRAEEVGFIGAVHLARAWPLGDCVRFISLETSSPVGGATLGAGPVVRVGDRMTVFDDEVTGELLEAAKQSGIEVQRCLLDGGSCEATAMQLYGVRAAGISVLLNDYHNCGADDRIVCESVSFDDVKGLVALIASLVRRGGDLAGGTAEPTAREAMKARIEQRLAEHQRFAVATQERFDDAVV